MSETSQVPPGSVNVVTDEEPPRRAVFVCEGWWHPNCKSGQVHDHPERPNGSWSQAMHRLCEPVYTKRKPANRGVRT